jgi:hypothetical protein
MRESDLPDHEQRAWDAIVADLSGQIDLGPEFPRDPPAPPLATQGDIPDPLAEPVDIDDDEDRYVPPPPPPLPRPSDTISRFSWSALAAGPLLVVATNLLNLESWLAGVGVALTVGGFVALIARMKDREDDGGNGAIV